MGNPRSLLAIGATTVLAGIAIAATGDPTSGGVVTVLSLVLLIYALHRFGRSGPDPELDFR
ncbi:MAG: hypothetical protein HS104_08440 [Polyangiaceae bacterium]|nr:hypothetical protein [Polyangiaceae bacterium]MBK8997479.1 hypothetical protein [Myxococcales bacterium]MCE7889307.1 hypothetical protein [Sorangiineae bacterium PRO1]MCL4755848.1 hypothetical protein [Myxococcales bacterium]